VIFADDHLWPIKCPKCGAEFIHTVAEMKVANDLRCPDCGVVDRNLQSWFSKDLARASEGALDPWEPMLRIRRSES
jgi:uncharacterized C2H2 Zn-finger protein